MKVSFYELFQHKYIARNMKIKHQYGKKKSAPSTRGPKFSLLEAD